MLDRPAYGPMESVRINYSQIVDTVKLTRELNQKFISPGQIAGHCVCPESAPPNTLCASVRARPAIRMQNRHNFGETPALTGISFAPYNLSVRCDLARWREGARSFFVIENTEVSDQCQSERISQSEFQGSAPMAFEAG